MKDSYKSPLLIRILSTILLFTLVTATAATAIAQGGPDSQIEAQGGTITGRVMDVDSNPMPGVNVLIMGENIGTATDADGYYEINVPGEVTLIFSMIGYQTNEINTSRADRKSTRLNSSHVAISYAVFCLKKKKATGATDSEQYRA